MEQGTCSRRTRGSQVWGFGIISCIRSLMNVQGFIGFRARRRRRACGFGWRLGCKIAHYLKYLQLNDGKDGTFVLMDTMNAPYKGVL